MQMRAIRNRVPQVLHWRLLPHTVVASLEAGHDGVVDVPLGAMEDTPFGASASLQSRGERVSGYDQPFRQTGQPDVAPATRERAGEN